VGDLPVRASDLERERAVELLRSAGAEGRLSFEELADRVGGASEARTREELARLTADLPVPAGAVPGREVAAPVKQSSVFGDLKRTGAWIVPASSRWETVFGDIVLDLREATVTEGVVRIDAGTIFGDVQLLVPEGVLVEVRGRVFFGDVRQEAGAIAPPGAPRVVLEGATVFGDVRVRARRRRERLAEWTRSARSP